jgi:hypothetical protein
MSDDIIKRGIRFVFLCLATLVVSIILFSLISLRILSFLFPAFDILVALASLAVFIYAFRSFAKYSKTRNKQPENRYKIFISVLLWLSIWIFIISSWTVEKYKARSEIRAMLGKMNVSEVKITIDGVQIIQKGQLFEAIKNIHVSAAKEAAIYERLCVLSCSTETLTLTIGRDRNQPDLFWVYYPKYKFSKMNVIGAFNTDIAEMKQFDTKSKLYP